MSVKDVFLDLVSYSTGSDETTGTTPSTPGQKVLGAHIVEHMKSIGIADARMDEMGYVYGTIPATAERGTTVGFIAHMDTYGGVSGENIHPQVIENYDGGAIALGGSGLSLSPAAEPALLGHVGKTLITTDGTTLLGGDDKAAVTALMTMAEYFCSHPGVKHGPIQLCFTPDEEVGRGTENFDVKRFGADLAYTVDGDALGGLSYETFNGIEAQLVIHGLSVHPGTAKGIMKNAVEIGGEFMAMLPALERPQFTEGREGYYHPFVFEGTVERAAIRCLIRDHELDRWEERKAYVEKCVDELNRRYGGGTVELSYTNTYYSMREVVGKVPFMVDYARQAMRDCGVEPFDIAMRGGTDGSWISQLGLPCPNITAGYENAHGRFEFVPVQSMEKNVEILIQLMEIYAGHKA